jgi:hypothetical protein
MTNKYRVDVSNNPAVVPAGMNSIRYIGDDWEEARKVFHATETRRDAWNQRNSLYGVILSVWTGDRYMVKCIKGFTGSI